MSKETSKNYCEFIGDETRTFDSIPKNQRICEWAGFSHCTKTRIPTPLSEDEEGWRLCHANCDIPFYVKPGA